MAWSDAARAAAAETRRRNALGKRTERRSKLAREKLAFKDMVKVNERISLRTSGVAALRNAKKWTDLSRLKPFLTALRKNK